MRDRDRVLNTLKINQSNETQLGKQGAGEINQWQWEEGSKNKAMVWATKDYQY